MTDIMLMGKNPNYLGSWDLYDLPGNKITATIGKIIDEEVVTNGKSEACTVCHFTEQVKPMILNLTNKTTLARLYKTKAVEHLVGKRVTIGYDKVKAFGTVHDALRIKNEVPAAKVAEKVMCDSCGREVTPANGMTAAQVAKYTASKYGSKLCAACAKAAKKAIEEAEKGNAEDVKNEAE